MALRYMATVLSPSMRTMEIAELYFPEYGAVYNAHAGAFYNPMRNRLHESIDGPGKASAFEEVRIPVAVAAKVAELAELTRRREALAEAVRSELLRIVPLDSSYELRQMLENIRMARERGVDQGALEELSDITTKIVQEGPWLATDRSKRLRDVSRRIAALPPAK